MNSKKIIAVILALVAVVAVFAACGGGASKAKPSKYESAEAVLNAVWAKFGEDEAFPIVGGLDYENSTGAGKLDVADKDTLVGTFGFPEAEIANIDSIASIMHAMNGNVFTAVAFHVVEGADMAAVAESYKKALGERQWFCGQPDGYAVIKVDSEYMIAVYAQQPLESFKAYAAEVLVGSEVLVEASLAQ